MTGNPAPPTITSIDAKPLFLETVKALWRANSRYLGMFPEGAFDEYAAQGSILVADVDNTCAGYLLYRRTRRHVAITHLCVREDLRAQGIAARLVRALIERTQDADGISLRCRRDFPANDLWPHLGFCVAGVPQRGRGRDGGEVITWWRNHARRTLFSEAANHLRETKVSVVMDANVLFDQLEPDEPRSAASFALTADWLQDSLELFVTDEVYHEIDRGNTPRAKQESRALAESFHTLPCESGAFDEWYQKLRPLFPPEMTPQDQSDLRQVARAVAGKAQYMVTRDGYLLSRAAEIEELTDLKVLEPAALITTLDELRDESQYQPARFLGTTIDIRAIRGEDVQTLATALAATQAGEKPSELRHRLQGFLSKPNEYRCVGAFDSGQPVACLVMAQRSSTIEVPLLRVPHSPAATTWMRQLVLHVVRAAVAQKAVAACITEESLATDTESVLHDSGFFENEGRWVKLCPPTAMTPLQLAAWLRSMVAQEDLDPEGMAEWADLVEEMDLCNPSACCEEERRLWPVKIMGAQVPCYIVPIEPRWAAELFDDRLASDLLFARKLELALNVEAVYYRSAHGPHLEAPARILWYVSSDDGTTGSMQIRACSYLDEAVVAGPKELYRRFRRLGIYAWEQVYATAKHDIDHKIMALRFSGTELLAHPIGFHHANAVLAQYDRKNQFQGPVQIPPEAFLDLYAAANR